ncbi:hypothetical protein PG994_003006 [Apiospora phragmitis]|uniref:Uncharacterized protein n=1 Tax=Apiospora phragmitis TaxID=2905665 RepID=A0ABR1W6T9_9PEZI
MGGLQLSRPGRQHCRKLEESQGKPEALKATVDFCNLMADCAWFVHDNDTTVILSLVTDTGKDAYYQLSESTKDPLLEADILLLLSIRNLRGDGDFKSAETNGTKSLELRERLEQPQSLEITNCYNCIAVACDSLRRHAEAKMFLLKSREILEKDDDELHIRLLCQNNLNYSRNLFCRQCLSDQGKSVPPWIKWRRENHVSLARETLDASGVFASISWISGIVSYRACSVAMKRKEVETAIDEPKGAVAIARLYKMPPGMCARFAHHLMNAYLLNPEQYQKEADGQRQEAQRLRKLLPPGRTDLDDESGEAFDMLVDISVR